MARSPSAKLADRDLLERCLAHDTTAWDEFVERFSRLIYSVTYDTLRRHGADASDDHVDELFGAVFLALYDNNYRKLRQWSGRCSLASWIRLVAGSVVVDHLRRLRPAVSLSDGEADPALHGALVDPGEPALVLLERVDGIRQIRAALARLSSGDRELLVRLYQDELSPAALAAELGIKPGALYTRKNRALNRLREAYLELDEEQGCEIDADDAS